MSKLSWEGTIRNLQGIFDEANQLRLSNPRPVIGLAMGRELAMLALEYKRLGEAVDWLWRIKDVNAAPGASPAPIPINGLVRLWTVVSSSRLGSALLRSARLRALARWLLAKLEARHRSVGPGQ